jgi:DNA processing protein
MLYYKGNTNLNSRKTIAVVGSRKATTYGKDMCEQIINELALHDPIIISGLAYGVDVTSHKSALKNNLKTVGVLGHGLSMVYPAGNRRVAAEMCSQGGLISEFLSETKPSKENFPKRNRIIAGMADVTIVIESAEKGGSLITAEIANGYNREVFAIPGRISDKSSMGCNMLINTNQAILMRSAKDLEQSMGWTPNKTNKALKSNALAVELTENQKHIIELLADGAQSIDFICNHISSNHSEAASNLLNLEFSGQIKSLPGKMYQLN